jgi:hypothetical protein
MARTSYISATSWQEQVTFQLHHGKTKLHFSYIMTRTSYISATSWQEQVTFQLHHDKNKLHFSYIMARPSYISATSWQEQVTFRWVDDDVHFVLDQNALLDFKSVSPLKQ